jgi:YD repeat-containing protein
MPNESAHGNGGLLTTARDLLVWNEAMDRAALGQAFADSVVKRFVLANGRSINYALGINVVNTRGPREVYHSGSTGGYRAHLVRFPEVRVSVAVLCNGSTINATAIAYEVARPLLPAPPRNEAAAAGTRAIADTLRVDPFAGIWVHEVRRTPLRLTAEGRELRRGTATLRPIAANRFADGAGRVHFSDDRAGTPTRMVVISAARDTTTYWRAEEPQASAAALSAFTGAYASDEVRGEPFRVEVEDGRLILRQSPGTRIALTPAYRDAFTAGGQVVWFTRDGTGRVTTMRIGQDRAWNVAFNRQ